MEFELPTMLAGGVVIAGRILLGGAFLFAGLRNATNVPFLTGMMTARGVPLARLTLLAGIAVEIIAGATLAAGLLVPLAAGALALFVLLATPMFHNFWDQEGLARAGALNGLVANVALTGGLLMTAAS